MNWFKNLNAKPRLMISFGVLLIITMGISYLAINALGNSNDRMGELYGKDMKAILALETISLAKVDIARLTRDGTLNIGDPEAVTKDLNAVAADFATMHAAIEGARQFFYTKEGKALLGQIDEILPPYERAVGEVDAAISAKDPALAKAKQLAAVDIAVRFSKVNADALQVKQTLAEEKFQANDVAYRSQRMTILVAAAVSLAFGVILSLVIASGFSVPLGRAVQVLEKVAEGDLTVSLELDAEDEVGRMAKALNRAVERLNSTMQEVADSAANASSSSQQLAAASEAIASGAQEQAASLEETSASLEEITATVRQSADNANQASQLAVSSKDAAIQGQEVVSKAITAMEEINVASAKISDIISTIDEIAFQTNLLAVNAAVEAARAGDEGRGFAVVASEVRSLAQRSAVAAKEIKVLIQDSLRKVDAGTDLVNRSGETLQGIVSSVKRVTDIVGEIAAAAGEQSTGIEQVNTAMTQMDQVTQSNSAQTEELSATAESLSEQAAHLLELVGTFTLSNPGRGRQDRPTFQPQAETPSPSQQRLNVTKPAAKTARFSAGTKPAPLTARARRPKTSQPAFAVAVAAGSPTSDANFEEF